MASTLDIWMQHVIQKQWSVSNAARERIPCPQRMLRKLNMKFYILAVKVLYVFHNAPLPPQDLGLAHRNIRNHQLTRATAKPGNHHNILQTCLKIATAQLLQPIPQWPMDYGFFVDFDLQRFFCHLKCSSTYNMLIC
jgi:hypothetical protein